ncbi:MAG: SDR family oxidoreductase, partial [Deltaproteobacteria bacterium]
MKRIFLTGGTGFIGSFLAVKFMKKGYELTILARGKRGRSAQERVDEILSFVDSEAAQYRDCGQYKVVEGDVAQTNLGVTDENACRNIDVFFHVAASTDFSEKNREEIYRTNSEGVFNALRFCTKHGINEFHHASTLFVSGRRDGIIREDELNCGQDFANPYESSKMFGEALVHKWGEEMPSRRFKIYRLPVVCGDNLTGKTTTFTGLYGFLAPFWVLKSNILRRFEHDGHRLLDAGIRLDTDNRLTIPLTIKISSSSSVELASVDWVVETMTSLFESVTPENLTFHLARKDKILAHRLVEQCMKFLGISGINIVDEIIPARPP